MGRVKVRDLKKIHRFWEIYVALRVRLRKGAERLTHAGSFSSSFKWALLSEATMGSIYYIYIYIHIDLDI